MKLKLALIGLGNIGFKYDMSLDDSQALSHVKALYLNDKFDLKYIVDENDTYKDILLSVFPNVNFYYNWKEIINKSIDVLVIALPTKLHYSCLNDFKHQDIKYYIMEKPLFDISDDVDLSPEVKSKIIVNYFRRFEPSFINIKNNIKSKKYGKPLKVINKYAKGLRHSGSHNIDLINYFFDDLQIKSTNILDSKTDYTEEDKTYDLFLKVHNMENSFNIFFIGMDETKYSIFEIELYFEKAKIKIEDFGRGLNISHVINDPDYDGYKMLDDKPENINTKHKFAILNLYNYIEKMHYNNIKNISSFEDENKNTQFLNTIYKEIKCQN